MKLKKILKHIEKRLGELPVCHRIDPGDKKLYRFIRDQFDGKVAAAIDKHYGINLPIAISCDVIDRTYIGITFIPTKDGDVSEGPMMVVLNENCVVEQPDPNIEVIQVKD